MYRNQKFGRGFGGLVGLVLGLELSDRLSTLAALFVWMSSLSVELVGLERHMGRPSGVESRSECFRSKCLKTAAALMSVCQRAKNINAVFDFTCPFLPASTAQDER